MEQRVRLLRSGGSDTNVLAEKRKKRANKNCPSEVTSKKPVARFRQVVVVHKNSRRDPRFGDGSCTKFSSERFNQAYSFLNEYKASEIADLSQKLKKQKDATIRHDMKMQLASMKREVAEKARERRISEMKSKQKAAEKKAVAAGKTPFYLKKSAKKTLELKAKYEELKENGKLKHFMTKKRRKNASKDHRWLPTSRKE